MHRSTAEHTAETIHLRGWHTARTGFWCIQLLATRRPPLRGVEFNVRWPGGSAMCYLMPCIRMCRSLLGSRASRRANIVAR